MISPTMIEKDNLKLITYHIFILKLIKKSLL